MVGGHFFCGWFVAKTMGFPGGVRGIYTAPEREVGRNQGHVRKRSVTAYVFNNRIVFLAREPPPGEEKTEVVVYSNNDEPTGYDNDNPNEWSTGKNPSVTIDHALGVPISTPLEFTSLQKREKRTPAGGGTPEQTPMFTFKYILRIFGDDGPWEFTKTTKTGKVKDWTSPLKPDPPIDVDPDPKPEEGMDSNLIMLAVVLMVAAAVAVNM